MAAAARATNAATMAAANPDVATMTAPPMLPSASAVALAAENSENALPWSASGCDVTARPGAA